MVKYEILLGNGTYQLDKYIVEVEEETTDYDALAGILIDRLEEEGREDCFIEWSDTTEEGGDIFSDEYVCGGNHGLLLYHGGNFYINKL